MYGRMQVDSIYHQEAFIEIMKVLGKYNITDCCMSAQLKPSKIPEKQQEVDKNG